MSNSKKHAKLHETIDQLAIEDNVFVLVNVLRQVVDWAPGLDQKVLKTIKQHLEEQAAWTPYAPQEPHVAI